MKVAKQLCYLSALALAPCLGIAAPAATTDDQQQTSTHNSVAAGMDPNTGKLRPLSDAEILALSIKANAMPPTSGRNGTHTSAPRTAAEARKTMRKHANGVITVDLPLSSLSWVTASIDKDGAIRSMQGEPVHVGDARGGEK